MDVKQSPEYASALYYSLSYDSFCFILVAWYGVNKTSIKQTTGGCIDGKIHKSIKVSG